MKNIIFCSVIFSNIDSFGCSECFKNCCKKISKCFKRKKNISDSENVFDFLPKTDIQYDSMPEGFFFIDYFTKDPSYFYQIGDSPSWSKIYKEDSLDMANKNQIDSNDINKCIKIGKVFGVFYNGTFHDSIISNLLDILVHLTEKGHQSDGLRAFFLEQGDFVFDKNGTVITSSNEFVFKITKDNIYFCENLLDLIKNKEDIVWNELFYQKNNPCEHDSYIYFPFCLKKLEMMEFLFCPKCGECNVDSHIPKKDFLKRLSSLVENRKYFKDLPRKIYENPEQIIYFDMNNMSFNTGSGLGLTSDDKYLIFANFLKGIPKGMFLWVKQFRDALKNLWDEKNNLNVL